MCRWLLALFLFASLARAAEFTTLSQSRIFSVYEPRRAVITGKPVKGAVVLEPELLAITADRVRAALIAQVPALGSGREKIFLHLMDQVQPEGVIGIVSTRFSDGWNYRLAIPPIVDETRLVRALVQVMLLEFSQRAGERQADLPDWVVEGLTQQMLHTIGPTLVVGKASVGWEGSVADLSAGTRAILRTNTAPSFHDLTTLRRPPPGAAAEGFYEACAHLLTRSLLQLPNGRQRFAAFLQMLAVNWNWQTAFQRAFGFQKMLDIEKWWALVTVEFTTRDQRQAWSPQASSQRLEELLNTRLQWRASKDAVPEVRMVNLKDLVREMDWNLQRAALTEKVNQLGYTALHLAPELGLVAMEYKKVLERYLRERERLARPMMQFAANAAQQKLATDTIRRINGLDAKRKALAPPNMTSAAR
jgi:hypothetical protein